MAKLSDIPRLVQQALESKKVLEAAGKELFISIPKRTRLGKGVIRNQGPTHKLPELKPKTVSNRKRLKKIGGLTGPRATPKKSGLNRTGEMLESLDYQISGKTLTVELSPTEEIKLINLLKINKDFQFMRVSAAEFKRVLKAMTKQIEQSLNKVKFTDF